MSISRLYSYPASNSNQPSGKIERCRGPRRFSPPAATRERSFGARPRLASHLPPAIPSRAILSANRSIAVFVKREHAPSPLSARPQGDKTGKSCGSQYRPAKSAEGQRSEEHTSELQSLMRISYAVFCLKKTNNKSDQI